MLTPSYRNSVLLSTSQVLAFESNASTIAFIEKGNILEAQSLNTKIYIKTGKCLTKSEQKFHCSPV